MTLHTDFSNDTNDSRNLTINELRKSNLIRFAITNSRSLKNKTNSAVSCFDERGLSFLIITETWFHDCPEIDTIAQELKNRNGVELPSKSRKRKPQSNRNPGGGIALMLRKSTATANNVRINTNGYEIMATRLKVPNSHRPLFVIATYLPPSLKAAEMRGAVTTLSDVILKLKKENQSPLLVLCGDFNGVDVNMAVEDYDDISVVPSPPTCQGACLDLVATNFDSVSSSVALPLMSRNEVESDHNVLVIEAGFRHLHAFEWIKFKTRRIDGQGKQNFTRDFCSIDWPSKIGNTDDPFLMTDALHDIIDKLNNKHFPMKEVKYKSTDKPWITDQVKHKIRRRKRAYRKAGDRSRKWKVLKADTKRLISRNKAAHY